MRRQITVKHRAHDYGIEFSYRVIEDDDVDYRVKGCDGATETIDLDQV